MRFRQDQRKTAPRAKYEACCSVQNAVQLTFFGPPVFPNFGPFGIAETVGIAAPSYLEIAS